MTREQSRAGFAATAGLAAALALGAPGAEAAEGAQELPLRLRATAVNLSNVGRTGASSIDIVIERWSTEEENAKLRDTLLEGGRGDQLLRQLQAIRPRAGFVRRTGLGWDLQAARQVPNADGSRRIVIATDRPIGFWEASQAPRSRDYEFMLLEIRLGKDGRGEGKLVPAAMIRFDQGTKTLEIENYATQPVRLTEVRVVN